MGLVAGFGTKAATTGSLTSGDTAGMVVGMVGANASVKISLSTLAYVFGPEAGGTLMRKKGELHGRLVVPVTEWY